MIINPSKKIRQGNRTKKILDYRLQIKKIPKISTPESKKFYHIHPVHPVN
tara:strand:- start:10846 stop:10995 length:150 start_codon:yes stop_codon:yes gene_type:complete